MLDRRHFLIGAERRRSSTERKRFLEDPARRWCCRQKPRKPSMFTGGRATTAEWRVSLGPDQPSHRRLRRRQHSRAHGHPPDTHDEIERACKERDLPLEELDARLNEFGWEQPHRASAKAHHLLKGLDLGYGVAAAAGQIIFEEFGTGQFLHMG